jgi:NADPH2:quinone reductase
MHRNDQEGNAMLAVGLDTCGGPEVLHLLELPTPEPIVGSVRIKVMAAGVNPADAMVRDGSIAAYFPEDSPPFVPGMDVAGIVDKMGERVDPRYGIAVGQAVVGLVCSRGDHGGYSQYVCLPADSLIPAPSGATFPEAASFLMNALTTRHALDTLALPPGSTLLVTGAAGAVGDFAVALGVQEGLRVVAVARSKDETFLRDAGVAKFVERGDEVATQVRASFPEGVDAVLDAAGLREQVVPAVRDGGTIIALRSWDAPALPRGVRSKFLNVRERATDRDAMLRLGQQAAAGLLKMRVAAIYPANQAEQAHRRLAERGLRGRIVLDFEGLKRP